MTSALSPSPWYSVLATYKGLQPEGGEVLASVAYHFLATHHDKIRDVLGGDPSMLTVVPSKRGRSYEEQALRKALSLVDPLRAQLRQTLTHRPGAALDRRSFDPGVFARGPTDVRGERVVLIEDTWVTGATSISAAGALLDHGAASVVLLPIARVVTENRWPAEHPYRLAMQGGYELNRRDNWPR